MASVLSRHQMVTVDPAAWARILAVRRDLADEPLLVGWAERGWPLVARRAAAGDVEGEIPLGLPLPLEAGRGRLTIGLAPEAVLQTAPPPPLADAAACAPSAWAATIAALLALYPQVRCFGGLAWQHLTGLTYLSKTSDLDLLWAVPTAAEADRLAERLLAIAEASPVRLDGEFTTSTGMAVQWREWASNTPNLMVKTLDRVRIQPRAEVLA